MYCEQPLTYTIRAGDSLYMIARTYGTTVEDLLNMNPGIDPYNLQIGSALYICESSGMAGAQPMPGQTSPDLAIPSQVPPTQAGPDPAIPDQTIPSQPAPPQPVTAPNGAASDLQPQIMPDQTYPGQTEPVPAVPDQANMVRPPAPTAPMRPVTPLSNQMRKVWTQHLYWMRMMINSIVDGLKDQAAVAARLLRNPGDVSGVFMVYYPASDADVLDRLLNEHIRLAAALVTASRDGNTAQANTLNRQLYANGRKLSEALGRMNPYYSQNALQNMICRHIDMTNQSAAARMNQNYQADIALFDNMEQDILEMADYLTAGIERQFS